MTHNQVTMLQADSVKPRTNHQTTEIYLKSNI